MTTRPVPVPDAESAPFWEATADGVLALPRCSVCHRFSHPPGPVCPHCHHTDPRFTYEPVPRRGTICSWTVVRQSFLPGFDAEVPFVLADVVIDDADDVRLIGRLVDSPDAAIRLGGRVAVTFERIEEGVAIPAFELGER